MAVNSSSSLPDNVMISRASNSDTEQLLLLWLELYQFHYTSRPDRVKKPDVHELSKEVPQYINNPDCQLFIAREHGDIIAFIAGQLCEIVSPLSRPEPIATIDLLYVSPDYRRTGVAQHLISKIEQEFRDYGARRIDVEVWSFNSQAIGLYQQQGYESSIHCLSKELN